MRKKIVSRRVTDGKYLVKRGIEDRKMSMFDTAFVVNLGEKNFKHNGVHFQTKSLECDGSEFIIFLMANSGINVMAKRWNAQKLSLSRFQAI
jgi:hypothetical protein